MKHSEASGWRREEENRSRRINFNAWAISIALLMPYIMLGVFSCSSERGNPDNRTTPIQGIAALPEAGKGDEVVITKDLDTITYKQVTVQKTGTYTYTETTIEKTVAKYVKPTTPIDPPPVVVEPVKGYELTFQSNFDKAADIKNATSDQAGFGVISTTRFTTSPASFYSVPKEISSGFRSEVQYESAASNPTEGALEYDAYYDVLVASHGHSMQWHPYTEGASASPGLLHEGGKFTITKFKSRSEGNQYIRTGVTIPTKRWVKFRWEFKFGRSGAYLRLYMDGKLIADDKSGWLGDGSGQYPKIGWNGFDKSTLNSRIYYDNLKIYKKI